jgi:hypothetical protein
LKGENWNMKSRRKFSKDFKQQAVTRLNGGQSVAEVARALEVHPSAGVRGQVFGLGDAWAFGPTTVNQFTIRYNRFRNALLQQHAYTTDSVAAAGILGLSGNTLDAPHLCFTLSRWSRCAPRRW